MRDWINKLSTRKLLVGIALVFILAIAVMLKSGYYLSTPFLPDGDTYFHGMVAQYLVDTGQLSMTVPYEYPLVSHGYPFNFHILVAQIHHATNLSVLEILRWFGPVISGLLAFFIFVLFRRISKDTISSVLVAAATLFIPVFTARMRASFPENIITILVPALLYFLLLAIERKDRQALAAASIVAFSAIGFHYTSYLLLPTLALGVCIYYLRLGWNWRNVLTILGIGLAIAIGVYFVYSSFWLFGFLSSFAKIYSEAARSVDSPLRSLALPAPTSSQWYDNISVLVAYLGIIGGVILLFSKKYSWWIKAMVFGFALTVLLPLQLLPALKVFSYTPFRAFPFIAIPTLLAAGCLIRWLYNNLTKVTFSSVAIIFVAASMPNYALPAAPGPGEQHLTTGEYRGISWLIEHTSPSSIVVTAPANGRQIAFFTRQPVAYDTSQGVFDAKTSVEALKELDALGKFTHRYIYISKYKLGPVYNFRGQIREYAYVYKDLSKFYNKKYFSVVFQDADSIIFLNTVPKKSP